MDNIWQQHKTFILKILGGLGVCLICWIIGASLSDRSLASIEASNKKVRNRIRNMEVPSDKATRGFEQAGEKLENRILFTAQRIGETRIGEDLRRGLIEGLLDRFGIDAPAARDRYLNLARQAPVACVIDLAGKAREYLVTKAGQNSVLLVEDVGYSKLTMEAAQFDRYLITLDAIVRIAETAIDSRVREIKSIVIGSPPGGRFEGEDVFIREYPVTLNLRGTSASLITLIEKLNAPERMLVITGRGQMRRDANDRNRNPDMLSASLEISALRIDPRAEIQE